MITLSLGLIVKDEYEQINRIIKEISHYISKCVILYDTLDVTKVTNDTNIDLQMIPYNTGKYSIPNVGIDFSHKRNTLHELIDTDYYIRMDTDDTLSDYSLLNDIVEFLNEKPVEVIYCWYNYGRDDYGQVNAGHYRETIIKKTNNIIWQKPIHENIVSTEGRPLFYAHYDKMQVNHLSDMNHAQKSLQRNLKYLIYEYNKDKENTDPRTLAYLGRSFLAMLDFPKAIAFLQKHLQKSGWDEDRYMSWCQLADTYIFQKNYEKAISCAIEGIIERPDFPEAYFKLQEVYYNIDDHFRSLTWAETGFIKKRPKSFMIGDPSALTWRPKILCAASLLHTNKVDEAINLFNQVKEQVPNNEWVRENEYLFTSAKRHKDFFTEFNAQYLKVKDDASKVQILINEIPTEFKKSDTYNILRARHFPPIIHNDNHIAIFCGDSMEPWSPKSVKAGIGGSEEAVIYMSQSLVKLGYNVDVYNNCDGLDGNYNGVTYNPFYNFNLKSNYNIIISWRCNLTNINLQCKKSFAWLHDIPYEIFKTKAECNGVDKILVLSKYHASLLHQSVPKEKIYITSNGILKPPTIVNNRQKGRCIYSSSYDRGLEVLLDMWKDVKSEVPWAELHIYYGWKTLNLFKEKGFSDNGFQERMIKKLKELEPYGVYEHGRIGHHQLLEEFSKSEILAYPCTFGETNCIVLTKAIAMGCYPVTSNYSAVGERNPIKLLPENGLIRDSEGNTNNELFLMYKQELIAALNGKRIQTIDTKTFVQENTWDYIAQKWQNDLFKS